jgi:GTP cyclohydrolase II
MSSIPQLNDAVKAHLSIHVRLFGGVIIGPEAVEIKNRLPESPYTSAEDDSEDDVTESTFVTSRKRKLSFTQPSKENATTFISHCHLPTEKGDFILRAYRHHGNKFHEPVVMSAGDIGSGIGVHVRVHDQCQTSEVLGSMRCDCREQLDSSLRHIQQHGGAVIYLQQEGRGIGLANKVAAYALQDGGMDTVDANRKLGFGDDERSYECVPFILKDMGIKSVYLMTNNPFKIDALRALGVDVVGVIPLVMSSNKHNELYIQAKAKRMGHLIDTL